MPAQVIISASNGTQELRCMDLTNRLLVPGGPATSKVFEVGQEPAWIQAYGLVEGDRIIVQMLAGEPGSPLVDTFRPAGGRLLRLTDQLNYVPILYPGRYRLYREAGGAAATVIGFRGTVSQEFGAYYPNVGDSRVAATPELTIYADSIVPAGNGANVQPSFGEVIRDTSGTFVAPITGAIDLPWTNVAGGYTEVLAEMAFTDITGSATFEFVNTLGERPSGVGLQAAANGMLNFRYVISTPGSVQVDPLLRFFYSAFTASQISLLLTMRKVGQ